MTPTEKDLKNLAKLFVSARDSLLNTITNYKGVGTKVYANTVYKQLEELMRQLEAASAGFAFEAIPAEYQKALDETYDYFKSNNLQMIPPAAFAQLHSDTIYGVAREMQYQIAEGIAQAGRQIIRYADEARDEALRAAGLEATGEKLASGSTVRQMQKGLIDKLQKQGFMTVQYGSGKNLRQVPLDAYAEMVARSTTREAGNLARTVQLTANGYDLVKMTTHYPTCDKCTRYEGRVYSISGNDKRFPSLATAFPGLKYMNVHPNCRHSVHPWVESLRTDEETQAEIAQSNKPFEDGRSEDEKELYTQQQLDARQMRQDRYQHERYRAMIGADTPKSFHAFRQIKKAGGEDWDNLQYKYNLYSRGRRKGVLPNSPVAATPEAKVKDYLLNSAHSHGQHKAKVINSVLGYNETSWKEFSEKLYQEVQKSPINEVKAFTYVKNDAIIDATKYVVPVVMSGKKGRMLRMLTVWQIDKGSNVPRFITATFPKKKGGV